MNIGSTGSVSQMAFAQSYGVAIAKKQQDQQAIQGDNALTLIKGVAQVVGAAESPQQLQPGQTINVMA